MAEDFQAGICGGNWWSNSRSVLSAVAASPCSMLGLSHDVAGFGWSSHNNNKARSNSSGDTNNSVCESPNMAFQEVLQKPHQSDCGNLLIDSTLQMMAFGLSPSDFTQSHNLIRNIGRSESGNMNNMYSILQEDMGLLTKLNSNNSHQIQAYNSANNNNNSYGYNSETLLQSIFEDEINQPLQQQQSHSSNNYISNYVPNNTNTSISPNVNNNNNNSWARNNIPAANYKQLQFSNNAPFWNASETVMASNASEHNNNSINNNNNNNRSSLSLNNFHSVPHQYATPTLEQKPKSSNNLTAIKSSMACNEDQAHQESRSTCSAKKNISNGNEQQQQQPVIKRARIETPSPLPTFKVRKEKLGDRITALQQLVSPFGKTDTASVLHEAIEYIKFLHDQVLSTPYMKNGTSSAQVPHKGSNKTIIKNQESPHKDLKSRGLCLVPISSTFPVANETTVDFWTPTFGGNFR